VNAPPPARPAPEIEAARAGLLDAREALRQADALARQNEDALTGEQARLEAAQEGLAELESLSAQLQANIAAGEEGIYGTLGERTPQEVVVIEGWIEERITSLARSRKAHEEAKARLAAAERTLDKAKAEEAGARERLGEKEASRRQLEVERSASQERLTKLGRRPKKRRSPRTV
jgi:chromosome segregation ATPase